METHAIFLQVVFPRHFPNLLLTASLSLSLSASDEIGLIFLVIISSSRISHFMHNTHLPFESPKLPWLSAPSQALYENPELITGFVGIELDTCSSLQGLWYY